MVNNLFAPTAPTAPLAPTFDTTGLGGQSPLQLALAQPRRQSSAPVFTGAGNDVITLGDGGNQVFAGEGKNLITTGFGDDLIYAGSGDDFINSGRGRDVIFAGDGNNRILAGKGNDLIYAGNGNDTIYGGDGDDTIYAGNGNNIVNAGIGEDLVVLGSGNDKLILEGGKGSVTAIGFNINSDKLRLGESLLGKTLTFSQQGIDTIVMSGSDLVATLRGVIGGSSSLVDNGPLYRYKATDLGSLSSDVNGAVNAASINDFGQIAGRYNTGGLFTNTNTATPPVTNPNNAVRKGFIWENGVMTALTPTGVKKGSSAFGATDGATVTFLTPNVNTISNTGVILGTGDEVRQPVGLATDRALIWEKEGTTYKLTVNDFGGQESYYFDTNNNGLIAGRNILVNEFDIPVYIENGQIVTLANLGGDGGTARGVNNRGQIVGFVDKDGVLDGKVSNTAILWEKGSDGTYQLKNLGTFGAEQASLRDLNDMGSIIGTTNNGTGATATSNPFILRDGVLTNLGSFGGKTGSVNGLNEFGQVVGASQLAPVGTAAAVNNAFVWNEGVQANLNSLLSESITYNGAAVTLNSAVSINNFGQIVATGTYTYKDAANKDATGTRSYVLNAA
jgi:hypothetical protein